MNEEKRDQYTFASYVLELWRKRFIIIIGTIICMAVTAIYVQYVAVEKYRSFAEIMIKEPRKFVDNERDALTPVSYEYLLLSKDLIQQVRNEFCRETGISPAALKLEKFKNAFQVESELVQDTTVKIEFSPVISMFVDAGSPEHAQLLMEIWLKHFMERYGDLLAKNSDFSASYYTQKINNIEKELERKEARFLQLRRELPFKIRSLTAKEIILAPAQVRLDYRDERRSYYKYRETSNVEISMEEPVIISGYESLERKLTEVDIDMAAAEARDDQKGVSELRAKKKAIQEKIDKLATEINNLQDETASMELEFQQLARDVNGLRDMHQYVMDLRNQTQVDAQAMDYAEKHEQGERSDIVILARPSLPELRIFPKKTFSCLIAGFVGLILSCLAVIFNKFLKESRILVESESKS